MESQYFGQSDREPTWEEAEAVLSYKLRHRKAWRRTLMRECSNASRGGLEDEPHRDLLLSIYNDTSFRYLRFALNDLSGSLIKYRGFSVFFKPTPHSPMRFVAYRLGPSFANTVTYSLGEMRAAIDSWCRLNRPLQAD